MNYGNQNVKYLLDTAPILGTMKKSNFLALTGSRVNGEYESSFALHNYSTFSVPPSSPFVSTSFLV